MARTKRFQPEGFGERLRDLWLESGLTQTEVAKRIGWERKSVSNWIYGDHAPDILALVRLCELFNVSADYLLFGKEKSMREITEKIFCDRCNTEITGLPIRIVPSYGIRNDSKASNELEEGRNEKPFWVERFMGRDFCTECIADIADFALNKNVCDECIKEMEENADLLSAAGDEKEGSGSQEEEPDPNGIDWTEALNRMEQPNQPD